MKGRNYFSIALIAIFVIGAVYLIKANQPVNQNAEEYAEISDSNNSAIENTEESSEPTSDSAVVEESSNSEESSDSEALTFSMADVESRSTEEECWTVIEGEVYDLSTWISRHPGGPDKIIGLCGIDSTTQFEQMHGRSSSAKSALALLKIGTLN